MPASTGDSERTGLNLGPGDQGDAIRDLQQRLRALGYPCEDDASASYGDGTIRTVKAFQTDRGLTVDGRCGSDTWSALVEASYHLGDRLLYLRRPMLRGDDVAELQRRLGSLGFDSGRVDGIFGPDTEHALREFQRNVAITTDGVCGPDVLASLDRLGGRGDGVEGVAKVRERNQLLSGPRHLSDRRVVITEPGGLASLARSIERLLLDDGAVAMASQHQNPSNQARLANDFQAEVVVGIQAGDPPSYAAYYSTQGFESVGGHRLASELSKAIASIGFDLPEVRGMRAALLRETRMPTVNLHLSPVERVVTDAAAVSAAVVHALRAWINSPVD